MDIRFVFSRDKHSLSTPIVYKYIIKTGDIDYPPKKVQKLSKTP